MDFYVHSNLHVSKEETDYKPKVILNYDKQRGAVNRMDLLVKECSCNTSAVASLFSNFIELDAANAFVIYTDKFNDFENFM